MPKDDTDELYSSSDDEDVVNGDIGVIEDALSDASLNDKGMFTFVHAR